MDSNETRPQVIDYVMRFVPLDSQRPMWDEQTDPTDQWILCLWRRPLLLPWQSRAAKFSLSRRLRAYGRELEPPPVRDSPMASACGFSAVWAT